MGSRPHPGDCDHADECRPSPGGGHRRLVNALVIVASVLVFLSIVSLAIYCLVRRLRRRRQEHLLAADPAPGVEGDAAASDVEGGLAAPDVVEWGAAPEEDDEVAHHAWHIRTVGLDEAAIESIALTRYRAGAGTLGAADCSVCLGEFQEGELLRLLPACNHEFHVPCIDTWLRAHVNCPLCRADVVLDPAAAADSPGANADTGAEQPSISIEAMDNELGSGRQQNESQDLRVQIGQRDLSTSPEALHRQTGLRVQDFRRAASMDFRRAVSADEAPEHDPNSKENQGNGGAACWKVASASGRLYHMKRSLSGGGRWSRASACWKVASASGRLYHMKRSLSGGGRWSRASRHSRTRSSMLPS